MHITALEIANILGGNLEGNGDTIVKKPGKIEEGGDATLTFLSNPKYEKYVYTTPVAVLLVDQNFNPSQPILAKAMIRVPDVYSAVATLLEYFDEKDDEDKSEAQNNHTVYVSSEAKVDETVKVGTFAVIEKGAVIGKKTIIHPQVFIGKNVEIGEGCILYPGVKVHKNCVIGNNCILQSNVVIGGDGFGFAPQKDGSFKKIPQVGNVVIEDGVEIGANTTIDRATLGSTLIKSGTKIDNLVMIAHNVEIGNNTVVAAQAGFAGSSKIGNQCQIGGQSGFVGHIQVADGTKVQAQSGVAAPIKEKKSAVYGSPAISYKNYLKSYAVFKKLPDLFKRILRLEKELFGYDEPDNRSDS